MTWNTGQRDQTIKGLDFKLTCLACPEQYDVFEGAQRIGYVRLRDGYLYVEHTPTDTLLKEWVDNETDSEGKQLCGDGNFETDEERTYFLTKCADALLDFVKGAKGIEKTK